MRYRISPQEAAAVEMDAYIGQMKAARKAPAAVRESTWSRSLGEARAMATNKNFDGAKGIHFVALYALFHKEIYGSEPLELTPQERLRASNAATRMLRDAFDGDVRVMVEFMVWAWKRESRSEVTKRSRGEMNGWRLLWQTQFNAWPTGARLLSDFTAAATRAHAQR